MSYLGNFKDKINIKLKEKDDEEKKIANSEIKNINAENVNKNVEDNSSDNMVTNTATNNNQIKNVSSSKILEASKDDDPIAKLEEIEDRIDYLDFYEVPDSLGLQTKEVPEYDEEKVKAGIESELNKTKDENINKINLNYENSTKDLQEKKNNLKAEKENNEKAINEIYDQESLNLESQAIKRGIARSSIILGQLSDVEYNRAVELTNNLNDLNTGLADIENQISNLIQTRDTALENLDIEYAEELESKLEKSKEEYKKTVVEVIEFNNEVAKLEAEYKMDYEKNKLDWKEGVLDLTQYGYDEFRKRIQNAKYDYMISYLSQFPKTEAISILVGNANFKDLLGSDYSRVYEYLLNR